MKSNPESRSNVLIVDDLVENLRLLTRILRDHDYEVRAVSSGKQAQKTIERELPDLILLDINMPEMSGYELCAWLRSNRQTKDIPVIFLTALSEVEDKVKAFAIGGMDYITKPYQVEEVLARVRLHLALRKANQELAESYRELKELETQRDDLVHMLVHDMRTPLMVIEGAMYLLGMENAESAASNRNLRAAERSVRFLSRLANDMLDVSRLEEGNLPLSLEECDLSGVATEVVEHLNSLEPEERLTVESGGPARVVCDEQVIRRILENLVSNAIKHTPGSDPVTVRVTGSDERLRVEVQDQGSGIPPELRDRIFEKFVTAGGPRLKRSHSAGVGLSFCKLAVEAHRGTIGVACPDSGGSVFWFELPRE